MSNRFELVDDGYQTIIRDNEHQLNFAFVAETGHGLPLPNRRLAQRVVDWLNSLPPDETLLYPHDRATVAFTSSASGRTG